MRPIQSLRPQLSGLNGKDYAALQSLCGTFDYGLVNGRVSLREVIEQVDNDIRQKRLDLLDPKCVSDLAEFRAIDLAATLNRVRGLELEQRPARE